MRAEDKDCENNQLMQEISETMQSITGINTSLSEVVVEVRSLSVRLDSLEESIARIERKICQMGSQTEVMENHVINVENVLRSTPFVLSIFRALKWRTLPHMLQYHSISRKFQINRLK